MHKVGDYAELHTHNKEVTCIEWLESKNDKWGEVQDVY